MLTNPYDILGIERGADAKTIKRAYAKLVKQYHPEEHPEEWKRIHDAYEQAMKLVSGEKQKVSVLVPQNMEEQEWNLTNQVNASEEKEVPETPTGTREQKEAPHTPVGTSEQKEAPNVPIEMPEQKEAPHTPIGTPEQEKSPNTPIGMPEQKQAPNAATGTPEQKEAPNVPIEMPEQKEAPHTPIGTPEQKEAPNVPIEMPEQKETPNTPTGTPEQKEAPNVPIEMPEQKEAPYTPIGTPEQEKSPNTPIGMPEQKQAPNAATGTPEQKEAPNTPIGTPAPKIRQEVPETESEDIFGDVDEIAGRQREQEESAAKEKLESAIREMRQLIWDNKFQKKEWKKFFERGDLLPVISQQKFLRELGDCFELKQIEPDLYSYLNEQLEAIAEYIKEYNTDLTRSRDLAAVKYAKAKVRLAHKRYAKMREERKEKFWGNWAVPIVLVVMFIIGMVYLNNEEQRKKEEQQRQEVFMEWQDELMRQNAEESQKQAQDMLNADPDLKAAMIERMKKELRSGEITQEVYDFFVEYYGIDLTQSETETAEESTDADAK